MIMPTNVSHPPESLEQTGLTEAQSVELALAAHAGMVRAPRMLERDGTDAVTGSVHWAPAKSLWIGGMTAIALVLGPQTANFGAVLLFIVTTAVTVCLGHSLGMHRRLIHRAYDAPLWLERLFVYLGTLVGMGGPFGMIRQHDIRDWAQRKPQCHAFLSHGTSMLNDYWWQNHCDLRLVRPPDLVIEPKVANDRFYRFIDRTQRWQQVPWAVLFYMLGGWPFVVWGIAVRVAASVTGHWLIGYLAHNGGARGWHVKGAGLQRALERPGHHGRELSQQSPRLPRLRPPGPVARPDRSRLAGPQGARPARPRVGPAGARHSATARRFGAVEPGGSAGVGRAWLNRASGLAATSAERSPCSRAARFR
jgi:fatty-acid desaturase